MEKLSAEEKLLVQKYQANTFLRDSSIFAEDQYNKIRITRESRRKDEFVPESFDGLKIWGDLLAPVMNQGQCGSCWSFAAVGALGDRFNINSQGLYKVVLSPTKLILCDWSGKELLKDLSKEEKELINANSLNSEGCFGNTLYEAWRYLYIIGTNTIECLPYDNIGKQQKKLTNLSQFDKISSLPLCDSLIGEDQDMCADYFLDIDGTVHGTPSRAFRAFHIQRVPCTKKDGGTERNLRQNIWLWGSASSGFRLYLDFYKYKGGVYWWDGKGEPLTGHAVVITGFGEENGIKYWQCRNSWGKDFGHEGYFKIRRGTDECGIESNVVVGIPDYFYPNEYLKDKFKLQSGVLTDDRVELSNSFGLLGGGIDPNTGYSRRVLSLYPNIDKTRPVSLENLPPFDTFISGIDSNLANRTKYKLLVTQQSESISFHNKTASIFIVLIIFLCIVIIILLFFIKKI